MASANSPLLKKVVINSIDVSSYVSSYETNGEYNNAIGTATIILNRNVSSIITIDETLNNKSVTIQRGVLSSTEKYIFRGEVVSVSLAGGYYSLSCKDKYYEAQRTELNTSFDINIDTEAGKISEIFKTIINDYTANLVADNTSIQDSGSILLLNKFICNHTQDFERLDVLAKAMNWQHYYEPVSDLIYFEPKGFVDSGEILTVGENIVNVPTWKYNSSKIINQLTVLGAQQLVGKTIFQNGTNAEGQTVSFPFVPISVKVYVGASNYDPNGTGTKPSDNNANLKTGGKKGTTSATYDYFYDDDKEVKKLYFYDSGIGTQPSFTPSNNTSNIEVQYSYNLPTPVFGKRQFSIDTYQLHETTIKREDIKTVDDAEIFLNQYLDKYQFPLLNTTILVDGTNNIVVGRSYRVIDSYQNIDRTVVALKIKKFYPYKPDEIDVGYLSSDEDDFETSIYDRVKRLEEKESETSDFLIQIFGSEKTISYEPRYLELQVSNVVGETGIYGNSLFGIYGTAKYGSSAGAGFILGHPIFGILGTSTLGSSGSVSVTTRIIQGNNTYKEFLYDDDFKGTGTATWDTINKEITFTSGQSIVTSKITLGTSFKYFTLNLASVTGSILCEISGDNGNSWQTVVLGVRTLFNVTNNLGVLLRFTENNSSTAKIENTYLASGEYLNPAIKLILEE